jgi:transcriptional regulator with XRE-family HTH domain
MWSLREQRILSGLTQHRLARRSNVDRSKISLVETGQAELTAEERERVVRVLNDSLQRRAELIAKTLSPAGSEDGLFPAGMRASACPMTPNGPDHDKSLSEGR